MAIRTANARWEGTLTEGTGVMRTGKGGLEGNYSFKSRFEEGEGTNPEELIGAAHAGCFSMALSKGLADAGFTPVSIETTASVHLDRVDGAQTVTQIDLVTVANAPGIDDATFQKVAEGTKEGCPISRLLSPGAKITLSASLA
jgi:lipoyl-dependent peroxiredoxin